MKGIIKQALSLTLLLSVVTSSVVASAPAEVKASVEVKATTVVASAPDEVKASTPAQKPGLVDRTKSYVNEKCETAKTAVKDAKKAVEPAVEAVVTATPATMVNATVSTAKNVYYNGSLKAGYTKAVEAVKAHPTATKSTLAVAALGAGVYAYRQGYFGKAAQTVNAYTPACVKTAAGYVAYPFAWAGDKLKLKAGYNKVAGMFKRNQAVAVSAPVAVAAPQTVVIVATKANDESTVKVYADSEAIMKDRLVLNKIENGKNNMKAQRLVIALNKAQVDHSDAQITAEGVIILPGK